MSARTRAVALVRLVGWLVVGLIIGTLIVQVIG